MEVMGVNTHHQMVMVVVELEEVLGVEMGTIQMLILGRPVSRVKVIWELERLHIIITEMGEEVLMLTIGEEVRVVVIPLGVDMEAVTEVVLLA
jgi:hypothetical protein